MCLYICQFARYAVVPKLLVSWHCASALLRLKLQFSAEHGKHMQKEGPKSNKEQQDADLIHGPELLLLQP